MMEYMKHCDAGTIIYYANRKEVTHHRMTWIIEHWCFDHLFSYDGYKKAINHRFHYYHKIPLYLCDDMMLIPLGRVRDYDMMWINHASVKRCENGKNGCKITFMSGATICVAVSLQAYHLQVNKLEEIRNTKVKHFH